MFQADLFPTPAKGLLASKVSEPEASAPGCERSGAVSNRATPRGR